MKNFESKCWFSWIFSCFCCSLPGLAPSVNFHASLPRAKEEETAPEPKSSSFDPLYALPLGIAAAVPAIHYEWYLVNEETQVSFELWVNWIYRHFGWISLTNLIISFHISKHDS